MKYIFTAILVIISCYLFSQTETQEYDFRELEEEIDSIMQEYKVPGAQFAIVNKEGVIWNGNFGWADATNKIPVTDSTMFRIGSITKSFVAVSIMKLIDEGKLNLNDKIGDLVPEIQFENEWEATNPVRIVHALEHTTGFDDVHLPEYAAIADGWTTLEGLTFHPDSRWSRYEPGMHTSYCNSGPPIAAYVVEKTTGQTFEEFVGENVFGPLEMNHSSFFYDPYVEKHLSKAYADTKLREAPYWHLIARASGAINSTALEMANYVRFFLNRGVYDTIKIIEESSVDRIETPGSTLSAKEGCSTGYALNIINREFNGITYFGHSGGMEGFLSMLTYIPDIETGYFFSMNLSSGTAFGAFQNMILNFLLKDLADTTQYVPATTEMIPFDATGYYRTASSRNQAFRIMDWLTEVYVVKEIDGKLYHTSPLKMPGEKSDELFFDGESLVTKNKKGYSSPLVFADHGGVRYMQIPGSMRNYYKTTCFAVWWQLIAAFLCILLILTCLLLALIRFPIWIFSKKKRKNLKEKIFPVIAAVLSVIWVVPFMLGLQADAIQRFGNPTIYSVSLTVITILFGLSSIVALLISLRSFMVRMYKFYRIYFLLVSLACLAMAFYMFHWGWIGIRFWVY